MTGGVPASGYEGDVTNIRSRLMLYCYGYSGSQPLVHRTRTLSYERGNRVCESRK
jgi:hypothetical protein